MSNQHLSNVDDEGDSGVYLPKWFTMVVSGFMGLTIPWATWVSYQIMQVSIKMDNYASVSTKVERLQESSHETEKKLLGIQYEILALGNKLKTPANGSQNQGDTSAR